MFASLPHFLHGDPILTQKVRGLNPDAPLHDIYLDIEPTSGIPLQAQTTWQYNIQVNALSDANNSVTWFPHLRDDRTYVPLMWVKFISPISSDRIEMLQPILFLHTMQSVGYYGGIGGSIFFGISAVMMSLYMMKSRSTIKLK